MNLYYLGSAINSSGLYMIAGSGAALSIKSGELNLGGEGQIYLGGFCAAIFLSHFSSIPAFFALTTAYIISFSVSGLLALLSGILKQFHKADFLFTSYLSSMAIIPLIDGLVSGPFRNNSGNLLATPFISQNFRIISILKPSPLNLSIFFSIIICILFFLLINRSSYGRKLCIFGISPEFAEFCNYNKTKLTFSSSFISGGMHGLCGALAITGTYYTCHCGFYNGFGWNSFSAALLAEANPLMLIPSSLFMGFITTYANKFSLYHNYGFDLNGLIQAVILLLISFPVFKRTSKRC